MNQKPRCWIYKSSRKDEMYLYLPVKENFDDVPDVLLKKFGTPLFVFELELDSGRKLARTSIEQVLSDFAQQGFHLQMPPDLKPDLYHGNDL